MNSVDWLPSPVRKTGASSFRADVLRGLRSIPKSLPCKYFYDEMGSELFERITALEEYYPTRTELAIMRQYAPEMAALLGNRCLIIEYGSGASIKTRLLLDHLRNPAGYVPIDVSREFLHRSARSLASEYPEIEILPLCADFTASLKPPRPELQPARTVVYFPGSTIGNFTPGEAIALLRRTAVLCGPAGGLLIGVDLQTDPDRIHAAYNDRDGVTAAFNLNLLRRINRELDGDFAIDQFSHRAIYDPLERRVEMYLVSDQSQRAAVGNAEVFFAEEEAIRTEYSYKYDHRALALLAARGGFTLRRMWSDDRTCFGVFYLTTRRD
jgi:dimethylhistidine N-methyltransferase